MAALWVVVALLFLIVGTFAQQAPPAVSEKISLLTLPNASPYIDRNRLAYGLWLLLREQNLELRKIRYILVIQVPDGAVARFGKVSISPILVDHWQAATLGYYEIWVVGKPDLATYLVKLQAALQHEFKLQQTDAETEALVSRAASLADPPCAPMSESIVRDSNAREKGAPQ